MVWAVLYMRGGKNAIFRVWGAPENMATNIEIMPVRQLQVPWTPHRPGQHPVSLFVVDEFFSFGFPCEFTAQSNGNIILVADRVGANSALDGADRFLPGLDAIHEITVMIVASIQVNLIGTNGRCQQRFRVCFD